jgi:hypothetical protein
MSDVQKEMKETLKLLKMIQEKTGVLEARLDFSGGKMSDVFRHLLQWFAEFDSDSGGLIQLQLDLFGSFEAFCNSPVLQGLSAENKVVQWRYLVAAARVEATELQMWKHFQLKSERAFLELEISGQGRSEKLDKQLKDMEKKIKETVENVINPTIRNCFRPEVENIIKDVNYQFQAAAVDFSKPGMFQLYLAKCRFQNLLAHLEMHVAKKLFLSIPVLHRNSRKPQALQSLRRKSASSSAMQHFRRSHCRITGSSEPFSWHEFE